MDGGAWWAAVYGVAQSWTRLKQLNSSSEVKVKVTQSCPTLCNPMDHTVHGILQNIGVGSCSLLQGIFSTQESNPSLLYYSLLLTGLKSHPSLFSFRPGYAQADEKPEGSFHDASRRFRPRSTSHRVACSPVLTTIETGHQARKRHWELICALPS